MLQTPAPRETLRFGDFELDLAAYELSRRGRPVRLGRQPMDLLILLIERRPQLVSRTEIVDRLWGKDVFVDVETGINTAISKVRQALRDSADTPAFVERVPGRGYRFVAAVDVIDVPPDRGSIGPPPEPTRPGEPELTPTDPRGAIDTTPEAASTDVAGVADRVPALRARWLNRPRLAIGLLALAMALTVAMWIRLRGGGSTPTIALAVRPFESLAIDAEHGYLAAGLTDETIASLAQIDPAHLTVKGRTVSGRNTATTPAELAQELSVDYLVAASIRPDPGGLHVTVTLLRVRDQNVWSNVYVRESTRLLGLPQEIGTDIAQQVGVPSSPERLKGIERRQARSYEALDAFFKARSFQNVRNPQATRNALNEYQRALALDPTYALAWVGIGDTYAASTVNSDADPRVVADLARRAAAEAIRLNPDLEDAQRLDGYVKWLLDWNWPAAEASLRRAIDLDPGEATASRALGHALSQAGRHAEAAVYMRRARELEPLSPMSYALSSQVAYQARDYAAAIEFARHAVLIGPDLWIGYMQLGQAYEGLGQNDVALEALTDAARRSQNNSKAISLRGYLLARMGQRVEARDVLRTLEETSHERYVPPYARALVYLGLDERDATFAALEQAYAAHDIHLVYLPVDPKWDPYKSDPRFVDLLARCGFTTR